MMIGFKTLLLKFDKMGEKSGWTYMLIPPEITEKLKPANKKSFRVRGRIDDFKFKAIAIIPMGAGDFIMPVNAGTRKAIKKIHGAPVLLEIEEDKAIVKLSPELLACLEDDPAGKTYLNGLLPSHQRYYSNGIESAKTEATKSKRIAAALNAFSRKITFSQMLQQQGREK